MKNMLMVLSVVLMVTFAGCSFLSKAAPSAVDEQGNIIPGTHELSPLAKDVTDAIPYGTTATTVLLFIWNFVERAKSKRTENGLMATIRAIEQAAKDPETKDAIAKLKILLSEAHQTANVQPLINRLLSTIKFKV